MQGLKNEDSKRCRMVVEKISPKQIIEAQEDSCMKNNIPKSNIKFYKQNES